MRAPKRSLVALFVLALTLPALAGCFGDEPAPVTTFRATASNPVVSMGWDYTGDMSVAGTGNITVDVDAATNTGLVKAFFSLGDNESYEVTWNTFAGAEDKPFQDGGIALNFEEHGDSGVGDALIPRVFLLAAGWGDATVTRNGQPLADPVSGSPTWKAHFMATNTGVRTPEGAIQNAARSGPYDPAAPGDASREDGDQELWLVLRNAPVDTPPSPSNITLGETVNAPEYAKSLTFDVPASGGEVALAFSAAAASQVPAYECQLAFSIKDPAGAEVATASISGNPAGAPSPVSIGFPGTPGAYTIDVSGQGLNCAYSVAGSVVPPVEAILVVMFEDPVFG